ncbi:hypothetical protein E3N88_15143 [Mikania micrantha]|uniref:Uncharacterized protein n=1 Tax=Mikania micrantha TaxID=192012 RepID=A0A5N6NWV7_9ASTR|nr:hypothetical protein E3N88_15143 [Mikania micrantha]
MLRTIDHCLSMVHTTRDDDGGGDGGGDRRERNPKIDEDGTRPRDGARGGEGRRGRQLDSGARRWGRVADGKKSSSLKLHIIQGLPWVPDTAMAATSVARYIPSGLPRQDMGRT